MKNYRVKVRDDKAVFFEELMRYLDFLDYEKVEGFSEPRIYSSFEISPKNSKEAAGSKKGESDKSKSLQELNSGFGNLREVIEKIEAMRDKSTPKK